ncbi:hypothetical protein BDZ85DRAFT_104351 [Elsinoe ampelina]|uniref:F-box domain-containing protein n=1 Tax=Elsinoe ampelina TaxID=302913 RepID=A0A6A6GFZ6_9PEZI|nr:hypothetical protein BDZ85DRAFT_104351 [Elsinoe ampelina]
MAVFPIEIFALIAKEVTSSADLLHLSLCSSSIHKEIYHTLYYRLEIQSSVKLKKLARLLYARPDLAIKVKHITVVGRCHAFSSSEGFPACETLAPHVSSHSDHLPYKLKEDLQLRDFLAQIRAGDQDYTRHWSQIMPSTTWDGYCAILLSILPSLRSIDITIPFKGSQTHGRHAQDLPYVFGYRNSQGGHLGYYVDTYRTMDILKAMSSVGYPDPQAQSHGAEVTDLSIRGEFMCGAYQTDGDQAYSSIVAADVLPIAAGFKKLHRLTLGNTTFKKDLRRGITPAMAMSLKHLELTSPYVTNHNDRWSILEILNPLESLVIKLGHAKNTTMPATIGDRPINGKELSRALSFHHSSLLTLKIYYFDCVLAGELREAQPPMDWSGFEGLRRLEAPMNFFSMGCVLTNLSSSAGRAKTVGEVVQSLPECFEELVISRWNGPEGFEETLKESLPRCKVVLKW